jgi:4-hydroxyphenylpyruvate dioxygenase-like putative hemolysin
MVSLSKDIAEMGMERARQFRMPFSRHIARLNEEDYRSGRSTIVIQAEETPEYREFRKKHPPPAERKTN